MINSTNQRDPNTRHIHPDMVDPESEKAREYFGLEGTWTSRECLFCCSIACEELWTKYSVGSRTRAILLEIWQIVSHCTFGHLGREWREATAKALRDAGQIERAKEQLRDKLKTLWGINT